MSKAKKTKPARGNKRRLTPKQLLTGWITLILIGTGAWYALAALPASNEIHQLEATLSRAENRLHENRGRVTELEEEIRALEAQVTRLDAEYATYHQYVGALAPITQYSDELAGLLSGAELEVTHADTPDAWGVITGPYRTATFTFDATGTYDRITTALRALESTPGVTVRELQIIKSGGDPNDPLLITRFTLNAHVIAN